MEKEIIGSEFAVAPAPLFRELAAFRGSMGYGGPLTARENGAARGPVRWLALEKRLAELRALLAAPDLPQPADAFAAYALLVHLSIAVDNKYFGPCDLSGSLRDRPICQSTEFFSSPAGVVGVSPQFVFLLEEKGHIEVVQRSPGSPMPFEISPEDRFAPLKQYAWRYARPFPLSAIPSRQERMRQYFAFVENAPAPEDRLQSFALTNWLFGALEGRHRALPGADESSRMFTNLPMILYRSAAQPEADIVLSAAHATFHHADGTVEMYARDLRRDVKQGRRIVSMVLKTRDCRLRGRPRRALQPTTQVPRPAVQPAAN